jgi:hypothetical protein
MALIHLSLTVLCFLLPGSDGARFSAAIGMQITEPKPPIWPAAYKVEMILKMPGMSSMSSNGLIMPVQAWYDGPNARSKLSSYNGTDSVFFGVIRSTMSSGLMDSAAANGKRATNPQRADVLDPRFS